jgi:glycosyltransferase involved in cell wall biosynthesis
MRANLAWKRRTLAGADAVIAVSGPMAADLVARAPELDRARIHVIPNPIDVAALERLAAAAPPDFPPAIGGPYAIYVGKLAPNKGSAHLVPAIVRSGLRWPLVIVGDGPDRAAVEAAAARARLSVHVTGWLDRPATIAWLARAALLVFPSHGPESLSRVLLESAALGVTAAAMDTGGTRDIVVAGETGLLSTSMEGLAADIARLAGDEALRRRLGDAARARLRREFDAPRVVERIAALYTRLVERRAAGARHG